MIFVDRMSLLGRTQSSIAEPMFSGRHWAAVEPTHQQYALLLVISERLIKSADFVLDGRIISISFTTPC